MKMIFDIGAFLLQLFPLTVFLKVAFLNGDPKSVDWLSAFIWGGCAAIFQLAFHVFYKSAPLNRVVLGVNWYLIIGGGAVITNQREILGVFYNLKESGIFLCLLMVGVYTTFLSRSGFVGSTPSCQESSEGEMAIQLIIRRYSIFLIILTCASVVASFVFRGNIIISAAVPLIVLSVIARLLKRRLQ